MLKILKNVCRIQQIRIPFYSIGRTYKSEANILLNEGLVAITDQNRVDRKLDIITQYFTRLWEARLGLVENKILFYAFMDSTLKELRKEFVKDYLDQNDDSRVVRAIKIHHVFNTVSELQIIRWEGMQDLLQWIRKPIVYELFQRTNKLHLFLKFISLLHQNQFDISEFNEKIENGIVNFKQNTPQLVDERLEYYKAINMLRQFDKVEKAHLKMTIFDLSKLENRQIGYSLEQLDILSQYINLVCEIFFPNLILHRDIFNVIQEQEEEEEDFEEGAEDDFTLIEPLARLIRLFLQQDAFWYKRSISSYRDKLVQKHDYIDLVDPLKWKQILAVSKGLWVLVYENKHERSNIDLLENAIFRKLETDTASISEGVQVLKFIEDIPEIRQGHLFLIVKSICDQINNQEYSELSLGKQNLADLLNQLFVLEKKAEEYELTFIQPAISRLEQWIKEGKFDADFRTVDWYDLQIVIQKHKYTELEDYVNQKLI